MRKDHSIAGTTILQTTPEDAENTQFIDGKTNPVLNLLFLSWLLTDDGVEHRNVLKSYYYLYHQPEICLPINKIVYFQHLLVSFEELLSLRLSDPFALVVGCINNKPIK